MTKTQWLTNEQAGNATLANVVDRFRTEFPKETIGGTFDNGSIAYVTSKRLVPGTNGHPATTVLLDRVRNYVEVQS